MVEQLSLQRKSITPVRVRVASSGAVVGDLDAELGQQRCRGCDIAFRVLMDDPDQRQGSVLRSTWIRA